MFPTCRLRPAAWRPPARRGFTLTEILVVITIIAILAALASVAVVRALDTAKQTRIKAEVDLLDAAFKSYYEKYGSYPPCDLRIDSTAAKTDVKYNLALRQHLARAFPRYDQSMLQSDLQGAGVDTENFRPDQAIVFWLSGFNPDVTQPFYNLPNLTKAQRTPAFFDFDITRLATRDIRTTGITSAIPSYFPSGVKITTTAASPYPQWQTGGAPYVYFDAHTIDNTLATGTKTAFYGTPPGKNASGAPNGQPPVPNAFNFSAVSISPASINDIPSTSTTQPFGTEVGTAVPYWNDLNTNGHAVSKPGGSFVLDPGENWVNADTFQIISPGGDGKYGLDPTNGGASLWIGARMYPTGVMDGNTYTTPPTPFTEAAGDDDNVTNFCDRARIGDAKP